MKAPTVHINVYKVSADGRLNDIVRGPAPMQKDSLLSGTFRLVIIKYGSSFPEHFTLFVLYEVSLPARGPGERRQLPASERSTKYASSGKICLQSGENVGKLWTFYWAAHLFYLPMLLRIIDIQMKTEY